MCTVTYIPVGKDTYFITSNRDEAAERSPERLTQKDHLGQKLIFPQDTKAGGSWIMASPQKVLCLLNGAFETHHKKAHYRMSRGLMALEYFNYPDALTFIHDFDFRGIEPFTLLLRDPSGFFEFRRDEQGVKHLKHLAVEAPQIWSSSTLYNQAVRDWRKNLFEQWLSSHKNKPVGQPEVMHFHQFGSPEDRENGFVMNRNDIVKTVSITCLKVTPSQVELFYADFVHGGRDHQVVSSFF